MLIIDRKLIIYFNSQLYTALRGQNFKSLILTYKTRILGLAALLSQ